MLSIKTRFYQFLNFIDELFDRKYHAQKKAFQRMMDLTDLQGLAIMGKLPEVKAELFSANVRIHGQHAVDLVLCAASNRGHVEIVDFILTSPELQAHQLPKAHINCQNSSGETPLAMACIHGHVEVLRYLLTSPKLIVHADVTMNEEIALRTALQRGHLPAMRYLMDSQEILAAGGKHARIENIDTARVAMMLEQSMLKDLSIVHYLVLEKNISYTQNIKKLDNEYLNNLFAKRELKTTLEASLPMDKPTPGKKKKL